ncbi:AMIN domain-containing protein [methane-oxidizing endosymbiont of Gigantopelta aegis]|uniref:AMIN domain-containing protein n=1 Tax=methane-oxidizing endosymbiont of Gigantopelta aegis TaxID=2794938 RepID=UPI001FDAB71D|nr:AMIN domain-containing protein [methane-oxidizing endosymbiont of Gigantopelta aegis]
MYTKQNKQQWGLSVMINVSGILLALALCLQASNSMAETEKAIENLQFSTLAGNRVQIVLGLQGEVGKPKIFETDNPARIALDFDGVKSHLAKKSFPVKQGAVNNVYVIEAGGRTRVIVNLNSLVAYKAQQMSGKFFLTLDAAKSVALKEKNIRKQQKQDVISKLVPRQEITALDFRRGPKGEGRLLLKLSNPNTIVDIKERGDKVVLNFLNTRLPANLAKQYDVMDFATPVRSIIAKQRGNGVSINIKPVDGNFEYSSFQSEGMLTVEFRPLSEAEKLSRVKSKFPFTGKKLTLNFQDIEVRSVLQILADFTNLNIIASDSVKGNVTLRLNDVPWDQALALVLKSKGLAKRQSGNVIFVAPASEITKMEEEELAAKKVVEKLEPLRTEYIPIQYAKAEEIQALLSGRNVVRSQSTSSSISGTGGGFLTPRTSTSTTNRQTTRNQQQGLLSPRGTSTVDSRTNTLIIRDTAKQLEEIHKMIAQLDIPVRQVMIESRIVVATTEFARNLGVKFGVAKQAIVGSGKNFAVGGGGTR